MGFNKQDERIYDLFNKVFKIYHFYKNQEQISLKYCIASDLIRLPLLNITGGIYLDMDTEITGEIGALKSKYGFNFNVQSGDGSTSVFCNFFVKPNRECPFFNSVISQYIVGIKDKILAQTVMSNVSPSSFMFECLLPRHGCVIKDGHICYTNRSAYDLFLNALLDFSSNLPSTVVLDDERRDNWKINYNNPEDLEKLGINKQANT
ncbi:glycosyltransferase [Candidatus Mesenet endosymbiont of Agriotes lineatus]|uniref:glycosyltransferase n=1 Tax=Candidatus Mesenet endosymbiont of Agriotes lineatus TaxID=3077948 RepID=UPI0030D5A7CC